MKDKLKAVFSQSVKPDYSILSNIEDANFGDVPDIEENWECWEEISDELIDEADMFFIYCPEEYAKYFMPRFMIFILDEIQRILPEKYIGSLSGTNTLAFLIQSKNKCFENLNLTKEQCRFIEEFIELVLEDEDYKLSMVCHGLIIDHGMDLPSPDLWNKSDDEPVPESRTSLSQKTKKSL